MKKMHDIGKKVQKAKWKMKRETCLAEKPCILLQQIIINIALIKQVK